MPILRRLIPILFCVSFASAQTSPYPSALDTNTTLTDLADRAQTTLSGSMTSSAVSFTVVSGSKFAAHMILTIDSEQIKVWSVVGNTVHVGDTGLDNLDGRAYAGTSAASHASAALVSDYFVSWQFKAIRNSLIAVETALGVNLANVVANPLPINKGGTNAQTAAAARTSLGVAALGANSDITSLSALSTPLSVAQGGSGAATVTGILQGNGTSAVTGNAASSELQYLRRKPNNGSTVAYEFTGAPVVSPVDYNFTAQTPGGSLTATVAATVTLTPCPLGVAGTDSHHMLYVSAGTGTAEPVTLTGGTCTSGATTGTVIFTPANNHSSTWTIQSATAGAQEACLVNSPCNLVIPAGTYNWYGTFWSAGNTTISGGGAVATILQWNSLTTKMFDIERDRFLLRNLKLLQVGTAAAGNAGVYMAGTSSNVASAAFDYGQLSDLLITGFYNGLKFAGDGGSIDLYRVHVFNSVSDQIVAAAAQGYWNDVLVINGGANGINLSSCPVAPCGYSPFMSGMQTYGNNGWGITSTIFVQVAGQPSFFNNDKSGEIYINLSAATSAENGFIADSYFQYAGLAPAGAAWATNTSAPGILLDTGSGPITIANNHFLGMEGNCINLKASLVNVTNNRMLSCGVGAQAGNIYGILVDATHGFEVITGNHINVPNRIDGLYNVIRGNVFYPNSASPGLYISVGTDIVFDGNQFQQAGAGTAYTIDAAVTLMDGYNVVTSGTVTYNGQRSSTTKQLNPFPPHSIGANVASAGTITPTGELFHITGVAAIATINLPGGYNGPRICAIPDGIFTTTAAGNIALASTAVVNKLLCWMYETTSAKWYPSY